MVIYTAGRRRMEVLQAQNGVVGYLLTVQTMEMMQCSSLAHRFGVEQIIMRPWIFTGPWVFTHGYNEATRQRRGWRGLRFVGF